MFPRRSFLIRLSAIAAVVAMIVFGAPSPFAQEKVTVFAAASLKNALDSISKAWEAETGKKTTISYAASSALAKQIEHGAPADIFISADLDWMKYLSDKKLVKPGTQVKLLGNQLVLIAPKDSKATITIAKNFDLAGLLGAGRLAMANVDSVPAGKYGKAALTALGVWPSVEKKLAQAENVRAALLLVTTGEAPLGIVYKTDAVADPKVKIIGTFPEDTHEPIVYPAALIAASNNADATAFLKFLQSKKAKEQFEAQGFTVLAPVMSN